MKSTQSTSPKHRLLASAKYVLNKVLSRDRSTNGTIIGNIMTRDGSVLILRTEGVTYHKIEASKWP